MALVLCATVTIEAAPAPELSQFWDASDETRRATISHREWQELLDAYLTSHPSGINRFDYGSLHANPKHRAQLASYVLRLAEIDPRTYARAEQMAYWINLYNALTVFVIVRRYPVDSIKDISSGLFSFGPWEMEVITVQGQPLTLDDIEHRILRPIWRDPRIHYGVNCASLGCPNLALEAYRSDNLERLLEQGARDYVNHPRGVTVQEDGLLISSIYEWFKEDFGGTDEGVFAHLKRYAAPELAKALDGYDQFDHDYDWSLNRP